MTRSAFTRTLEPLETAAAWRENLGLGVVGNINLTGATTIEVGTGGDVATLNEAIALAAAMRPNYVSGGVAITIQMLTGYALAEQVFLHGVDLSHVRITSVDATVLADFTGDMFRVWYSRGPLISCLFDKNDSSGKGFYVIESSLWFTPDTDAAHDCGVIDAGDYGLDMIHAFVGMSDATITGSGEGNVRVNHASTFKATGDCDFSDAGTQADVECRAASICDLTNATMDGTVIASLVGVINGRDADAALWEVERGGTISLTSGSTGLTSQTPNELTANGIIYDERA